MAPLDREGVEDHVQQILQERAARFTAGVEALGRELAQPVSLAPLLHDGASSTEESVPFHGTELFCTTVKALSRAGDQIALLDRVLEGASQCFSRACLFLVRGEAARGWSSVGLPECEEGDPARSLSVPLAKVALLRDAIESRAAAHSDESADYAALLPPPVPGERIPRTAVAVPLIVRGSVSAILYGDDGGDGVPLCDFPSAEVLACIASLAADRLAQEAQRETPGTVTPTDVEIRIAPLAETASEAPETELLEPDPMEEELEYASFARESPKPAADLPPEEARLHEDAQRFARLLVSELLLYNEDVVVVGRRQRDIYERLKDEIDKSRQAYDQRVPEPIRSRTDYFREELIRTLAQGDALALGRV